MPRHVVCPACYEGACGECTGSGCYCDCQMPSEPEIEEEFTHRFKGCEIILQRPDSRKDWYIVVIHKSGGYLYDGYWRDSEDKTRAEALAEAKKGACLVAADEAGKEK